MFLGRDPPKTLLYLNTRQRSQKGENRSFISAGWSRLVCPVTQLQWEEVQNLRMAVVQDAWEMKGPWTQMFWVEAVTNSMLKKNEEA